MIENAELTDEMTEALGRAVVACWNDMPPAIQHMLFEAAAEPNAGSNGFRGALAMFLHDHNRRTADAGNTRLPPLEDDDDMPPLFPPGRPR